MDVAGWLLAHCTIRCDSLIASASQLRTLTGAPNRIVGFDRGRVFVATDRSQVPGARTSTAPLRVMLDGGTDSEAVTSERRRRDEMWQDLGAQGGPEDDSQWFVAWGAIQPRIGPRGLSHVRLTPTMKCTVPLFLL